MDFIVATDRKSERRRTWTRTESRTDRTSRAELLLARGSISVPRCVTPSVTRSLSCPVWEGVGKLNQPERVAWSGYALWHPCPPLPRCTQGLELSQPDVSPTPSDAQPCSATLAHPRPTSSSPRDQATPTSTLRRLPTPTSPRRAHSSRGGAVSTASLRLLPILITTDCTGSSLPCCCCLFPPRLLDQAFSDGPHPSAGPNSDPVQSQCAAAVFPCFAHRPSVRMPQLLYLLVPSLRRSTGLFGRLV